MSEELPSGTPLSIAYSPCPNDTFVFHAWAHGLIPDAPPIEVAFADIDITNGLVNDGRGLDVMKISYAALPEALADYELLPCGGALGRGCGPLLLIPGRDSDPSAQSPLQPPHSPQSAAEALTGRVLAVPSLKSTAYLLFQRWAEQELPGGVGALKEVRVLPFHEIMPAVRAGQVDAGLVIHEASGGSRPPARRSRWARSSRAAPWVRPPSPS
jgi:1,4-dihydroxy-6-naphthoate synthase